MGHDAMRTGSPLPRANTTLPARSRWLPGSSATSVSAMASSSPVTALMAPRRLTSESSEGAWAFAVSGARHSARSVVLRRSECMGEIGWRADGKYVAPGTDDAWQHEMLGVEDPG